MVSDIQSIGLINHITNGNKIYVKLRNTSTGLYVTINETNQTVFGSSDGAIFMIEPHYLLSKMYICTPDKKIYMTSTTTSAELSLSSTRNNMAPYTLTGNIGNLFIQSNYIYKSIYNEDLSYLCMSDSGSIFTNGSIKSNNSIWSIDKINDDSIITTIRYDYQQLFELLNTNAKKIASTIFFKTNKVVNIRNVKTNKYLNISLNNVLSYDNKIVVGDNIGNFNFMINDKYVNIIMSIDTVTMHVNTIPHDTLTYISILNTNWSKFYILQKETHYLIRCIHEESSYNGTYGRYLCVSTDGLVLSNGSDSDENSLWDLEYKN